MVRDRFRQFTQPREVGEVAPAVVIATMAIAGTLVVPARLDLAAAASGQAVVVGPPVALALLDESLVYERVEVGVEASVVDLLLVVVFEFFLDREAVWLLLAGDDV